MTLSNLTKAQLVQKVRDAQGAQVREMNESAKLRIELDEARGELGKVADKLTAAVRVAKVPEADALAGCIRALDSLPSIRSRNSYSGDDGRPDHQTIRRVLVALADKYGVDLIERATEPCNRVHLDQVPPVSLTDALGAVMGR